MIETTALMGLGSILMLLLAPFSKAAGTLSGAMMLLFAMLLWADYADAYLAVVFVLIAVIIWVVTLTREDEVRSDEEEAFEYE